MSRITVLLGFDMETDVGSWSTGYEGLVHGTPKVMDLLDKHEVAGTFYFTGASVKEHPEVARAVRDRGFEVGAHSLFHETVGEPIFKVPGDTPILPEEVEGRLALCTDWVEEAVGARPVSFRCPRLFGSTAVVNALENLGYVSDATYPMYHFEDRLTPYHPDAADWTKEGDLKLVELPNFADMSIDSKDEYGRDRDQWPLFRTQGAAALMKHIEGFMGYCAARDVDPFLCFYLHPWEFHPMPQGEIFFGEGWVRPMPFCVENCGPYALEQLDLLIGELLDRGANFCQARQIAEEMT